MRELQIQLRQSSLNLSLVTHGGGSCAETHFAMFHCHKETIATPVVEKDGWTSPFPGSSFFFCMCVCVCKRQG